MSDHQRLDNVLHKDLRIVTDRSAWYGDDVAAAQVFPAEFRRLQAEYPLFFQKNETSGEFESIAMFGFEEKENLYLNQAGWDASYIPLSIERQPFLIGFGVASEEGVPTEKPLVHVDMDSPRVSQSDGVPVFLEHGGQSPYLERINAVLAAIHQGHDDSRRLSAALTSYELLEPLTLEFELANGDKRRLQGLYTLHEDRLRQLHATALQALHADGQLEHIYMAMASIACLQSLIDRKNARL